MPLSLGDEICTFLEGAGLGLNFNGAGTINCFSTLLPDQPDLAVAVVERPGMAPIVTMTGAAPPVNISLFDRPSIQVMVRSGMTGYTAGNTLMENVFGTLHNQVETTLNVGGQFFHWIGAAHSPAYLGRDMKERHTWSLNLNVWWENLQRVA